MKFLGFLFLEPILLPIKSSVASAVFLTTLFEEDLSASVTDSCLSWSKSLWLYF